MAVIFPSTMAPPRSWTRQRAHSFGSIISVFQKLNKSPHGRAAGTLAALAEGRKKAKGEMNL
jgi:hypothetical protein